MESILVYRFNTDQAPGSPKRIQVKPFEYKEIVTAGDFIKIPVNLIESAAVEQVELNGLLQIQPPQEVFKSYPGLWAWEHDEQIMLTGVSSILAVSPSTRVYIRLKKAITNQWE